MSRLTNALKNTIRPRVLPLLLVARRLDRIQQALARIELRQLKERNSPDPLDWEFQATSQWGEDGLIQFLLSRVPMARKVFVEFGVSDYTESNTRFLLEHDNWSGLVLDGSDDNIRYIRKDLLYWRCNLKAQQAFITRENINELLSQNGLEGDIGLLSIDIDGNDYWIWEAIHAVQPRIVVTEFNTLFGPEAKIAIPYKGDFYRTNAHYSNLYFGASLGAMHHLAARKGYSLVCVGKKGVNAFFVRNDVMGKLEARAPRDVWPTPSVRESQDPGGNLTFLSPQKQLALIAALPVVEVDSGTTRPLGELVRESDYACPDWENC